MIQNKIIIEGKEYELIEDSCGFLFKGKKYVGRAIPPVLFTSRDGVEIREGDECFGVDNWHVHRLIGATISINRNIWKIFSTEEKACQFVRENKPCLSWQDIVNISNGSGNMKEYDEYALARLVKSKIDDK